MIVVGSTLGILMSIPGQTMGVSVFTDSLLTATGLSRLSLSNAYLAGTIASSLMLPWAGRWLDRWGARLSAVLASVMLALALVFLAQSDLLSALLRKALPIGISFIGPWMVMILGFTLLRFSGQGLLTLSSRTMLGKWFDRRRGMVAGISGVFVSCGFSAAPKVLATLINAFDWQGAWFVLAAMVGLGMGTFAWVFFRDNPEECGLRMDGDEHRQASQAASDSDIPTPSYDRAQALSTLAFWSITLALSFQALIMTGVTFHVVDIGAAAGLSKEHTLAIFVPAAVVSIITGYTVGVVSARVPFRWLIIVMMAGQTVAMIAVSQWEQSVWYGAAIVGLGLSNGFLGPMSTVVLPAYFGRTHLGAIAGFQMMCMVFGSAIGPSWLAWAENQWGGYTTGLRLALVLPAIVVALTLVASDPRARKGR